MVKDPITSLLSKIAQDRKDRIANSGHSNISAATKGAVETIIIIASRAMLLGTQPSSAVVQE